MDNKRLGKGLRALIPEIEETEDKQRIDSMSDVRVASISPNPFQPREEFSESALNELKQSISEKGVIQPITVRKHGTGFQLISGERRLRAVSALNLETIPAYIIEVDSDEELLELALIENIQREDLNAVDIAKGYQQLINRCELTQEQVAQKVGKDRSTVTNFLRLLKLPEQIQESLRNAEIDMGHARALLSIDDSALQTEIWKKILKHKLSVRKVESLVKQGKDQSTKKEAPVKEKPYYIVDLEDKLQQRLGTKVLINSGKKGGKIEIEYYSEDELDRIIDLLTDIS